MSGTTTSLPCCQVVSSPRVPSTAPATLLLQGATPGLVLTPRLLVARVALPSRQLCCLHPLAHWFLGHEAACASRAPGARQGEAVGRSQQAHTGWEGVKRKYLQRAERASWPLPPPPSDITAELASWARRGSCAGCRQGGATQGWELRLAAGQREGTSGAEQGKAKPAPGGGRRGGVHLSLQPAWGSRHPR